MTIKPDAFQYYFAYHPDERTLAQSLGEAFDANYGGRYEKGSRSYSFWFANPQTHTCECFGLRHEVLAVHSQHTTTDGRVLRAIRDILGDGRFRHRLDRALILLIHKGDPSVTNELLYSEEQDLVIVPFTSDELFDSSRGSLFIRQRIAEYFGEKDLFQSARRNLRRRPNRGTRTTMNASSSPTIFPADLRAELPPTPPPTPVRLGGRG